MEFKSIDSDENFYNLAYILATEIEDDLWVEDVIYKYIYKVVINNNILYYLNCDDTKKYFDINDAIIYYIRVRVDSGEYEEALSQTRNIISTSRHIQNIRFNT